MKTLLFLPTPEHAESILREGPCCAMPPTMIHGVPTGETEARWYTTIDNDHPWHNGKPKALVLVHEGAIVPEGMDRLARVLAGPEYDGVTAPRWDSRTVPTVFGHVRVWELYIGGGVHLRFTGDDVAAGRGLCGEHVPGLSLSLDEPSHADLALALTTIASARGLGVSVSL